MNKAAGFIGGVVIIGLSFGFWHLSLNNYAENVEERISGIETKLEKKIDTNGKTIGIVQKELKDEVNGIYDSLTFVQKQEQSIISTMNLSESDKEYIRTLLETKRLIYIMELSNPKLSRSEIKNFVRYILKYSKEYGISPVLVAAQIHRESSFRANLVSKANAKGCMQVIYKYHKKDLKDAGISEKDLLTIKGGIQAGCIVLSKYIDMTNGDIHSALMWYVGYNASRLDYAEDIFKMSEKAYSVIF